MRQKTYHEIHLYDGMAINDTESGIINQKLEKDGLRLELVRGKAGFIVRLFTEFSNEVEMKSIEEEFISKNT